MSTIISSKTERVSPLRALAHNVRYLRYKHHMSVSELSRKSGLSRQILYKVEDGTANLRMDSLAAIARAFNVDIRELLG